MPEDTNWRNSFKSRRSFLKYGVVGGAALIAGCAGDGSTPESGGSGSGGGTSGSGGGGSGEMMGNNSASGGKAGSGNEGKTQFQLFDPSTGGTIPTNRHFNPWNPTQSGCWHPGACVFDRPAIYSPTKNEAYPLMATDWQKSGDKVLEVTFSKDWTWHNGDQFVAQDWVMQQEIDNELTKAGDEDTELVVNNIEVSDDQHIKIHLNQALSEIFAVQNTIGVFNGNLGRGVFTKHDDKKWKNWHKRLKNTSGDEKMKVVEEITTAKYPKISSDAEWVGHGPFQVSEVSSDIIVMEKYNDHPNADNINFDQYVLKEFSQDTPVQPFSNGLVDAAFSGFPVKEGLKSQLPEQTTLYRQGRSSNNLITFNCGHDIDTDSHMTNKNVRKAVAHVYDRQGIKPLLSGVNKIFDWAPCRVPAKVLQEGNATCTEWVKDFEKYGQNNTKRATQLLKQEGFEKDGDQWLAPDGDRFQISIVNGAKAQQIQYLKQNLKDFGIAVEQEQVDDATFDQRRKNGNFDIIPDGSSANGITSMWAESLVIDWLTQLTHFNPDAEIPMPVGDTSGSSGTKEINVADHITKWQTTGKDVYHKELMWWWNQTLPEIEVLYKPDAGAYNAKDWSLNMRDGIKTGVDDAIYIAPKLADAQLKHRG